MKVSAIIVQALVSINCIEKSHDRRLCIRSCQGSVDLAWAKMNPGKNN